jgi:hypothetical protein
MWTFVGVILSYVEAKKELLDAFIWRRWGAAVFGAKKGGRPVG